MTAFVWRPLSPFEMRSVLHVPALQVFGLLAELLLQLLELGFAVIGNVDHTTHHSTSIAVPARVDLAVKPPRALALHVKSSLRGLST